MLIPYIRQSRKKEQTISLDEQRLIIKQWAKGAGVALGPEIVEQGVSGSKAWRERGLGRAVEACEQGRATGIIVAYQDRLSREHGLATAEVWEALDRIGARLVAAGEGLDTQTGDHEMLFTIKGAMAREEWKRHKANWAAGQRRAIEKGQHLASRVPAGYLRGEGGKLEPDPEYAPVIKQVFELRAKRGSWSEVAALVRDAGILNHSGTAYWSHRALARLVRNRVYLGEAFHGEFVNTEAHPALVEPSLWRAAQATGVAARQRRAPDDAFLAGVVRCAGCERPLKFERTRDRYRCRKGVNAGKPCEAPATAPASQLNDVVERVFIARLPLYLLPAEDGPDTRPLQQEVTAARAAYAAWLEADISDLDPVAFREGVATRKARVEAAEDALREAEAQGADREQLMLIQKWDTYSITEQNRWLKSFRVTVTVERGRGPISDRAVMHWDDQPTDMGLVAGTAGH